MGPIRTPRSRKTRSTRSREHARPRRSCAVSRQAAAPNTARSSSPGDIDSSSTSAHIRSVRLQADVASPAEAGHYITKSVLLNELVETSAAVAEARGRLIKIDRLAALL